MKHASSILLIFFCLFTGLTPVTELAAQQEEPAPPASNSASTTLIQITKVEPNIVYVERGRMEETCIVVEGTNLHQVRKAIVYREGRPYTPVFARFIPTASASKKMAFLVAPNAALDGRYQVILVTQNRETISLPLQLHVVTPGDSRVQAHLQERAKVPSTELVTTPAPYAETEPSSGAPSSPSPASLQLDAAAAPRIERVEPNPLVLPTGDSELAVRITGKNLNKITQVRMRPADHPPRYKGNAGLIPFEKTAEGLTFTLRPPKEAEAGAMYALDLIMEGYLAGGILFNMGPAALPPTASEPASQESFSESASELDATPQTEQTGSGRKPLKIRSLR